MPSNRVLAQALSVLILTLVLCAAVYNFRLREGLSDQELDLTLSVQRVLDRLQGPGRSSTWLKLEDARLHAIVTVDPTGPDQPERLRGALESLLNVDLARGDRLDIVGVPGHRAPSLAREWALSVAFLYSALSLGLLYLLFAPANLKPQAAPARLAWPARIGFGVLALGFPLWAAAAHGRVPLLLAGGLVLAVLGRPWRVPRVARHKVFQLAGAVLVAALLFSIVQGPEVRLRRQVADRLGAPAWIMTAQRGEQWGVLAAVRVSPGDTAPALRLAQLEAAARQSLPGVRLSLLGVQTALPRGPWRLIALNVLLIGAAWYALNRRTRKVAPRPVLALAPTAPPSLAPVETLAPRSRPAPQPSHPDPQPTPRKSEPVSVVQMMKVDPIAVEVGRGLLSLVDPNQGAPLLERVSGIRRHLALELGIVMPGIRFRDNLCLAPNEYRILMRTVEAGRGTLQVKKLLAVGPTAKLEALGPVTADPTFGLPGVWITPEQKDETAALGLMIFDPVSVVATQITELVKRHAAQIVGLQETKALLDTLRKDYPLVVEMAELRVGVMLIWEVLEALVAEGVSIRDLTTILSTMARSGVHTAVELTAVCRVALGAQICQSLLTVRHELVATELPEEVERLLRRAPDGVLEPDESAQALELLQKDGLRFQELGRPAVYLTPPGLRLSLRRLTERSLPDIICLAWTEVAPGVKITEP